MSAGMPKRQPRKVPNRSSLMTRQNSSIGASTTVLSCGVEPPALLCSTSRRPNVSSVVRMAAWKLTLSVTSVRMAMARRLLAGRGGDVRHDYPGTFAREQHCRGAADSRSRTSDEGDFACQSCHAIPPFPPARTVWHCYQRVSQSAVAPFVPDLIEATYRICRCPIAAGRPAPL
jgi:hypothetical protein